MNFDVAVIGAGIVGTACAASLSSAGLRGVLIDPNGVATGTTAAGMGHIVVMDDSEAQFALTQYSQRLWNELADELPRSCEFEPRGTIWVAADEEEMSEVHRKRQFYDSRGLETEVLDERALRESEPNLRTGLAGGLLVAGDSVVYQLTASRSLLKKALSKGWVALFGHAAIEILEEGVMLSNGDVVRARYVVNAAGISAPQISPGLVIEKRKGHLVITDRYPKFARHQLVELGYLRSAHGRDKDSVAFNLQPRATGQVLIGSSRQFGAENASIDLGILRQMIARAIEYMPNLKEVAVVRAWAGFRPATPDNLPYIGPSPAQENTYIAAGHEGLGITTALGTAALVTDMIVGREPAIAIDPYLPARKITLN